ncbi:MAG: hypothetical protein J6V56_03800 [Clostridia bacterium]|nr:hypothetical protein [Clostridia bacterium]
MKRKLITWGIVSVIIVVGLLGLFILLSSSADVTAFSLDDFQEEMEWHSADLVLGEVSNAKEAKSMAFEVFKNEYGFNAFCRFPYRVYFDEQHQAWLVRGSYFFQESGPCILISKSDGRVLAVWDYQF